MFGITINHDRVHICMNQIPQETFMFKDWDCSESAIGFAVLKVLKMNKEEQKKQGLTGPNTVNVNFK